MMYFLDLLVFVAEMMLKSLWKTERNSFLKTNSIKKLGGFPGGTVVENPPANAGDTGSSPGPGRSHMPRSGWAREPQLY